jgi:hypothetical protein
MASAVVTYILPFALFLCYQAVKLFRYMRLARATGLPYVITPVLETQVVGFLVTPILRYIYHDYLDQGKG